MKRTTFFISVMAVMALVLLLHEGCNQHGMLKEGEDVNAVAEEVPQIDTSSPLATATPTLTPTDQTDIQKRIEQTVCQPEVPQVVECPTCAQALPATANWVASLLPQQVVGATVVKDILGEQDVGAFFNTMANKFGVPVKFADVNQMCVACKMKEMEMIGQKKNVATGLSEMTMTEGNTNQMVYDAAGNLVQQYQQNAPSAFVNTTAATNMQQLSVANPDAKKRPGPFANCKDFVVVFERTPQKDVAAVAALAQETPDVQLMDGQDKDRPIYRAVTAGMVIVGTREYVDAVIAKEKENAITGAKECPMKEIATALAPASFMAWGDLSAVSRDRDQTGKDKERGDPLKAIFSFDQQKSRMVMTAALSDTLVLAAKVLEKEKNTITSEVLLRMLAPELAEGILGNWLKGFKEWLAAKEISVTPAAREANTDLVMQKEAGVKEIDEKTIGAPYKMPEGPAVQEATQVPMQNLQMQQAPAENIQNIPMQQMQNMPAQQMQNVPMQQMQMQNVPMNQVR